MITDEQITSLLKKELILAMGCTEPAACALAGAKAAELLDGYILQAKVSTTRDILKNAMGVSIPGFDKKGVKAAVSLGIMGGDVSNGLDILSVVTEEQKEKARKLELDFSLVESKTPIFIKVELSNKNHSSVAIVSGSHTCFSYLEKDGKVIKKVEEKCSNSTEKFNWLEKLELSRILEYAKELPEDIEKLLLFAVKTNLEISEQSLTESFGLSIGRILMKKYSYPPKSFEEALNVGAALAAGGSDARMAGCQFPVMINSGSGNQGLTITVPIAIVSHYLKKSDKEMAQAICVAELVGLCLTYRKDKLSALCGALTAAIGTANGLAYLMGGDETILEMTTKTMVGNLSGIICDGAKMTCALKIYSSIQSAYLACLLAFEGFSPSEECGIVGKTGAESVEYLSCLAHEGMEKTDETILKIMLDKGKR